VNTLFKQSVSYAPRRVPVHLPTRYAASHPMVPVVDNADPRVYAIAAPHLASSPLPTSSINPTAFNNSSVQFVRRESLAESGDWLLPFPSIPNETLGFSDESAYRRALK
jgi:hypothetical protein